MIKVEFKATGALNPNYEWEYVPQSEKLRESQYSPAPTSYIGANELAKWWVLEMKETVELTFEYSDGYRDTRTVTLENVLENPPRMRR